MKTVQTIYAAFGRGDVPAIIDLVSDDVTWESWADNSAQKAGVPWLLARQGKAGAGEFFELVGQFTIHDFQVWTFGADGKVTRLRHYTDTAKRTAAAGVSV